MANSDVIGLSETNNITVIYRNIKIQRSFCTVMQRWYYVALHVLCLGSRKSFWSSQCENPCFVANEQFNVYQRISRNFLGFAYPLASLILWFHISALYSVWKELSQGQLMLHIIFMINNKYLIVSNVRVQSSILDNRMVWKLHLQIIKTKKDK